MTRTLTDTDTIVWEEPFAGIVEAHVGKAFKIFPTLTAANSSEIPGWGTTVLGFSVLGHSSPFDGGAADYVYSASEPSHPGKANPGGGSQWAELTAPLIRPEMLGATGDGTTDDITPVTNCISSAVALGLPVHLRAMHAVSTPVALSPGTMDGLRIIGSRPFTERTTDPYSVGFRALAGFMGDAVLIAGDNTGSGVLNGIELSGFWVHGNNVAGIDGVQLWHTSLSVLDKIYVTECPTGWGIRIDRNFFPRLRNCAVQYCGSSVSSLGGGFRLSHDNGENSDGSFVDCYCNKVGNIALELDARSAVNANHRQTDWTFVNCEFGAGASDYESGAIANWNARIRGDRLTFIDCKFPQGSTMLTPLNCVQLGEDGAVYSTEMVSFVSCYWQVTNSGKYGVHTAGSIKEIDFVSPRYTGAAGKFMNVDDATNSADGPIRIYGGEVDGTLVRDPNRLIRTIPGGNIGTRYGATPDQNYWESLINGVIMTVRWLTSGGTPYEVKFGAGTDKNLINVPTGIGLRFTGAASPPTNPDVDTVASSNGTAGASGWGGSGRGLYRWDGAAWVFIG